MWERLRDDRGDIVGDLVTTAAVMICLGAVTSGLMTGARVGIASARNDVANGALTSEVNSFTSRPWTEITAVTGKKVTVSVGSASTTVWETIKKDSTTGVWELDAAAPEVHGTNLKAADCTAASEGTAEPGKCEALVGFNRPSAAQFTPPAPSGFSAQIAAASIGVQLATLDLTKLGDADATSLRLSVQPATSAGASVTNSWRAAAICDDDNVLHVADESAFTRATNGWLSATVSLAQVSGCGSPTIRLISTGTTQPTKAQVISVSAYRLDQGVA
jgi:hypothetical protein